MSYNVVLKICVRPGHYILEQDLGLLQSVHSKNNNNEPERQIWLAGHIRMSAVITFNE